MLLCNAWNDKMQWMFDLFVTEGPAFPFTDDILLDFEENPKVQICFAAGDAAVQARILAIRGLRPRA